VQKKRGLLKKRGETKRKREGWGKGNPRKFDGETMARGHAQPQAGKNRDQKKKRKVKMGITRKKARGFQGGGLGDVRKEGTARRLPERIFCSREREGTDLKDGG